MLPRKNNPNEPKTYGTPEELAAHRQRLEEIEREKKEYRKEQEQHFEQMATRNKSEQIFINNPELKKQIGEKYQDVIDMISNALAIEVKATAYAPDEEEEYTDIIILTKMPKGKNLQIVKFSMINSGFEYSRGYNPYCIRIYLGYDEGKRFEEYSFQNNSATIVDKYGYVYNGLIKDTKTIMYILNLIQTRTEELGISEFWSAIINVLRAQILSYIQKKENLTVPIQHQIKR